MGLYIKGLNMPEGSCSITVSLKKDEDGAIFCLPWGSRYPLIELEVKEIKAPHGKLVDVNALNLDNEVELLDDWKTAHEMANCVKYAPAVLEEDE